MDSRFIKILIIALLLNSCGGGSVTPDKMTGESAAIFPDYVSVVVPTTIAPLNFRIEESGEAYYAQFENSRGEMIHIESSSPDIKIPQSRWAKFCKGEQGKQFTVSIAVRRDGEWYGYEPFTNHFSTEEIDSHLAYRLIYPGYTLWNRMGIYQRELSTFRETRIVDNQANDMGCMNCHTFSDNSPERMMLHILKTKGGTVVARDGEIKKIETKTGTMAFGGVYSAWSRDGRFIAFSSNDVNQSFHTSDPKAIEVYDLKSDLVVYDVDKNEMVSSPEVRNEKYMETYPEWSADGDYLYFCRALPYSGTNYGLTKSRYDLCRISFDKATGNFGSVEVIYEASAKERSVSFPKCSPDGRYLVFTESDYGTFSIWHAESDLYLMDLESLEIRRLDEINSDNVDSFHCWSSNGKWMVFSSKRQGGIWARPYIAAFDSQSGRFAKPFVLPQEDPMKNLRQMETYNLPHFVTGEVTYTKEILESIQSDPTQVTAGRGVK